MGMRVAFSRWTLPPLTWGAARLSSKGRAAEAGWHCSLILVPVDPFASLWSWTYQDSCISVVVGMLHAINGHPRSCVLFHVCYPILSQKVFTSADMPGQPDMIPAAPCGIEDDCLTSVLNAIEFPCIHSVQDFLPI